MKKLQKLVSILSLFLCLFIAFPLQTLGEGTTNSEGKMRFKMERIGEGEKTQSNKETELEKIAPDLFKDETHEAIQKKQQEIKMEAENLEQILFTTSKITDHSIKDTKETLFAQDYQAPKAIAAKEDMEENNEGATNNVVLYSLIGTVVLLCGGIFVYMQKVVA